MVVPESGDLQVGLDVWTMFTVIGSHPKWTLGVRLSVPSVTPKAQGSK